MRKSVRAGLRSRGRAARLLAVGLCAPVAAAALLVAGPAAPASAAALDVVCTGSLTNTYTPGLTLENQTVSVSNISTYFPCVSLSEPAVTSGTTEVTVKANTSCLSLLTPGTGAKPITWNTGETSTFTFERTATSAGAVTVVTLTGKVVSGPFTGAEVVETETFPVLNVLDCLAPNGLRTRSAVVTLTVAALP